MFLYLSVVIIQSNHLITPIIPNRHNFCIVLKCLADYFYIPKEKQLIIFNKPHLKRP